MRHLLCAAAMLLLAIPAVRADEPADEAAQLARKLTTTGAATFATKDARAMAAYYTDDARIIIVSKDQNQIKTGMKHGRAEIESFYQDVFKDPGTIQARNTVTYARFIDPDILQIVGVFEPNVNAASPMKIPFNQVRVRQGDQWQMSSLSIYIVPQP